MTSAQPAAASTPLIKASATAGPLTIARQRRTAFVYTAMCVLGLVPIVFGMSPGMQAAGLGLWIPGGGFIATGGWAILLFPLTLALFALAVFAWFGAGAVIFPVIVWGASAALAGLVTKGAIWPGAPYLVAAMVAGVIGYMRYAAEKRKAHELATLADRNRYLPHALAELADIAAAVPPPGERELTPEDLAAARYALDRALQPVGAFNGYDRIDQFQTAALRYQINHLGYALAMLQCHYTPSFYGYLSEAQRRLIETYLERQIWGYWVYESAWGHLNLANPDPAGRDNIMLTGWFGIQVCLYMSNTGDRRYGEPGSLTFRLNERRAFPHDAHTIAQSVARNFDRSAFCLYPCEPNWIYPICNHYGMTSLVLHDRLFGTSYVADNLERWLRNLDAEFTDCSGSLIGLRSSLTGLKFPFPAGEAGFAEFENCFAPERARRMWAIARHDLQYVMKPGANGIRMAIPGRGFDFGNYKSGYTGAYAMIANSAREFGDYEIAAAAQRALDEDCSRTDNGGILRYSKGSNLSNAMAVRARFHRRDDFRNAIARGPAASALRGPIMADARYPDVLVARAFSDGEALDLVLYPGTNPGPQTIRIERLRPGAGYAVHGTRKIAFTADESGAASLTIDLAGRTPVHIAPRN